MVSRVPYEMMVNAGEFRSATITPDADADYTLTESEVIKDRLVLADGSWLSSHNIIVPDQLLHYYVDNSNGTYDATIKTSAGTGTTVPAGTIREVLCDGVDTKDALSNYDFTSMPQVSGSPIVESDSNSDGEWTRWADGTQLCKAFVTNHISGGSGSGEGNFGNVSAWPVNFVNTDYSASWSIVESYTNASYYFTWILKPPQPYSTLQNGRDVDSFYSPLKMSEHQNRGTTSGFKYSWTAYGRWF